VKRSEFYNNENLVQRDYNFLTSLNRTFAVKRQDTRQNKVLKRQRFNSAQHGTLVKRGVTVRYLPNGMQRSIQNKSGWDKKRDTFVWTVEFQLMDGDGVIKDRFQSLRVPEETALKDAIHFKVKEQVDKYWCFLRMVDCPASRPVVKRLDQDNVLADLFKGETVIEFPTIIVCTQEEIKGYKVYEEDSDKLFESGDSDSDSESSDSSDGDEPREESSKKVETEDERVDATGMIEGETIEQPEQPEQPEQQKHQEQQEQEEQ
jgi:hypothetical protein